MRYNIYQHISIAGNFLWMPQEGSYSSKKIIFEKLKNISVILGVQVKPCPFSTLALPTQKPLVNL